MNTLERDYELTLRLSFVLEDVCVKLQNAKVSK